MELVYECGTFEVSTFEGDTICTGGGDDGTWWQRPTRRRKTRSTSAASVDDTGAPIAEPLSIGETPERLNQALVQARAVIAAEAQRRAEIEAAFIAEAEAHRRRLIETDDEIVLLFAI